MPLLPPFFRYDMPLPHTTVPLTHASRFPFQVSALCAVGLLALLCIIPRVFFMRLCACAFHPAGFAVMAGRDRWEPQVVHTNEASLAPLQNKKRGEEEKARGRK